MTGSWGTELWDGYDPVTRHIKSGLVFVDENVSAFVKERAVIESEYANKLRRLVRKFTPKGMVLNTVGFLSAKHHAETLFRSILCFGYAMRTRSSSR